MAYAPVVIWFWVLALGATVVGLALAVRALGRADRAVAQLRASVEAATTLAPVASGVASAVGDTARHRSDLHRRAEGIAARP